MDTISPAELADRTDEIIDRVRQGDWIAVTDDGHGRTGSSAGHGLVGMRERATLYGGTFEAGPRTGGGFRVRASLPLEAS
jgi:signal transduction histidine kinase